MRLQQRKTGHRKCCVYKNIGNRRSVNAPIRDQEKVRNQRQNCSDSQKNVDVFVLFSDDKHHLDKAHNNADHESGGLQIEIPADGGKIQRTQHAAVQSKYDIARGLDFLNTNEKSIFLGLDGLGRYLNKYYKNNADDLCEFIWDF